ncbi:MAG: hypothetical protein IPL78_27120 [Chloroflexi bacterium]|nr:hypothetical protein [Chloroflexota bacterium]
MRAVLAIARSGTALWRPVWTGAGKAGTGGSETMISRYSWVSKWLFLAPGHNLWCGGMAEQSVVINKRGRPDRFS